MHIYQTDILKWKMRNPLDNAILLEYDQRK